MSRCSGHRRAEVQLALKGRRASLCFLCDHSALHSARLIKPQSLCVRVEAGLLGARRQPAWRHTVAVQSVLQAQQRQAERAEGERAASSSSQALARAA